MCYYEKQRDSTVGRKILKGAVFYINGTSIAAIVGGVALLGAAGATAGALTLFNRVIPRQDQVRVNLDEMTDMAKWEEYRKIIRPRKEWILERTSEHITIKSRDDFNFSSQLSEYACKLHTNNSSSHNDKSPWELCQRQ